MDELKNSESSARLRDKALARRLGEALDRLAPAGAGECPEAEIIAAYHEGTLQAEEIPRHENHFAYCQRCRKILSVLAASVDAPLSEHEVARLGKLVAETERPSVVEIPRQEIRHLPKQIDWRVRWLAPALGVAAVLAMWFAVRPPWRSVDRSENLIAQAPRSEHSPGTDALNPTEHPVVETQPVAPALAPQPSERSASGGQTKELTTGGSQAEGAPQDAKKALANSDFLNGKAVAPPPPPPPPASAAAQLQATNELASGNAPSAVPNSPARDKQAAVERTDEIAPSPMGASTAMSKTKRSIQALSSSLDASSFGEIPVLAPSGKILWRAGKAGKIQRSMDAGRTWTTQSSSTQQDWTAGAAPSETVCWLVGRNGAIARTTDGEHWTPIAPPMPASGGMDQLPDWTGVIATSELDATITSRNQKRYRTQDGGQSWQLLP